VRDRDLALNQRLIDKQRVKQRYNTKIQVETDKMNRELEMKLRQQREHLQVIILNFYSIFIFNFNTLKINIKKRLNDGLAVYTAADLSA